MITFNPKVLMATIISIITIIGGVYSGVVWMGSTLVTQTEFRRMFVELRTHQVDESLARYHKVGIINLDDADKHRYTLLTKTAETLEEERNALNGFTKTP